MDPVTGQPSVLYAAAEPRGEVVEGLAAVGYRLELVRNGLLALERAVSAPWDLIAVEWRLPGLEGLEIARVMRQRGPGRAPLVLVADAWEDLADGERLAPVDEAWVAPLSAIEVEIRAQHLRARRRALEQIVAERDGLRELAHQDPLTGLPNRRQLDAELARALAAARPPASPLSVLLFDVDRFKAINDGYGHPVGDRVLNELARVLRRSSRRSDVFGRWGGEEFLYLLPGQHLDQALVQAERVRAELAAHPFRVPGQSIGLTVSVGATEAQPGDTPESLMARVDQLLYEAKRSGRNRVVSLSLEA